MKHYSDESNGLYKSAITGAYFGILNILIIFIPLVYSLYPQKSLFIFYMAAGIIFLILTGMIPIKYKKCYGYDFLRLRFLYYLGTLSLVFFLGINIKYVLDFGFSVSNVYILLLQIILILMSVFDIYASAHKGMRRMRTMYLRTIKSQYIKNAIIIFWGAATGILLLAPFYL